MMRPLVAISIWVFPVLGGVVCGSAPVARARAGRKARSLATELARLRGEVERLSNKVEIEKNEIKSRVQSLARQKSELEMLVRREKVRIGQLHKRLAKRKKWIQARAQRQKRVEPLVAQVAVLLKKVIQAGLPFKRKDRAATVNRIVDTMKRKLITPVEAIARLWDRVEDELRLARENGLYSQVIPFGHKEQLVDVARLGMVLMYFRTRDGRFGVVRRVGGKWRFQLIGNRRQWKAVARLFDGLKKQIRTGFYRLPNALPQLHTADEETP
jgi:outer membrane murein-binding lipoprotein Lpp